MTSRCQKEGLPPMGMRSDAREQAIESLRRRNADLELRNETGNDRNTTLSVDRGL